MIMTMSMETACQKIADQLKIDVAKVKPESRLVEDLKADSLDLVELIMDLEQEYHIEIPDEVLPTLKTVQDVVDYFNAQNQ